MTATTPKRLTEEDVWRKYVRSAGAWTEREIHQHGWNGANANSPLPECVAALDDVLCWQGPLQRYFASLPDGGAAITESYKRAWHTLAAARAALSTEAQP